MIRRLINQARNHYRWPTRPCACRKGSAGQATTKQVGGCGRLSGTHRPDRACRPAPRNLRVMLRPADVAQQLLRIRYGAPGQPPRATW